MVIQGQSFYGFWKADKVTRIIMLALTLHVPKIWRPKLLKIAGSDQPTDV